MESDDSPDLVESCNILASSHPAEHTPTTSDLEVIRSIASFLSVRSSALVASALYALWDLRIESQEEYISSLSASSPLRQAAEADLELGKTTVSFNGAVIEKYPGYRASCQRYLDGLVQSTRSTHGSIELVPAKESSLVGAAVALACVERESSAS